MSAHMTGRAAGTYGHTEHTTDIRLKGHTECIGSPCVAYLLLLTSKAHNDFIIHIQYLKPTSRSVH